MKISTLIFLATALAFISMSHGQRPAGGGGRQNGRGGLMTCKTPTLANAANCNVGKAKIIGRACAMQLYKDCAAKNLAFLGPGDLNKRPGSGRGHNKRPANKRPGSGSGPGGLMACKTPTVANADNCNANKAKTIGRACAYKLHKDCTAKNLAFGVAFDGPNKRPANKRPGSGSGPGGLMTCKTPTLANAANCNIGKAKTIGRACAYKLHKDCAAKNLAFLGPNKRPGSGPGPGGLMTCKTPTVANAASCNVDTASKIGRACAKKLHDDCAKKNLAFDPPPRDCSNVTATRATCTPRGFAAVVKKTPRCVWRLKGSCRKWRVGHPVKPSIPQGCTSWFDGCNTCSVTTTGTKGACTKLFCFRRGRAYCRKFADGRRCWKSRASKHSVCKSKPDAVTKPPPRKPTCVDVASDMGMSDQEACRKAFFLCAGQADILKDCRTNKANEEKAACERLKDKDGRKKGKCCVQGKLSANVCKRFGSPGKLPTDCKTRCYDNGKFKRDVKDCVRCRGKGSVGSDGGSEGNADNKDGKRPFDPARVRDTIKEIASKLNEDGKTCVKRVAAATSKLKTQIQRWRNNNPTQKEEPNEQTDIKELADVQTEIDETAEGSKKLEDEFQDDAEGTAHREKEENLWQLLQDKISDENKPSICGTQFDALKTAVNAIVEEYSNLPAQLKAQSVERVPLKFSETDLGRTDLKDSKSLCQFAGRLVSQLKKAETNHKKRLSAARNLVCTKTGAVLKRKLISSLSNCLRKAKRDAQISNNADAQKQADDDANKFDNNALKRVLKLLGLMKKKCLMKDMPESKPAQVSGVFREQLKTKIKRTKSGDLTEADKKQIAAKFNSAVEKKYHEAKNITTKVTETTGRRQLHSRRALAAAVTVVTTWDVDTPSKAADKVDVDLGADFTSDEPELSAQPTSGSIEVTQSITPIDTNLPDGEGDSPTKKPDNDDQGIDGPQQADTGAQELVFGATALIFATMWLF